MVSFISSKYIVENTTWTLTMISFPTKPHLIEFTWHSQIKKKQDNWIYTTVQGFKGKSY